MTLKKTLKELESLSNEKTKSINAKHGSGDNQYGVKLGDIRKVAKKIKSNHSLAMQLWETGNVDARFLAILIMEPEKLSAQELNKLVRSVKWDRVADWMNSYVVKVHPDREKLRVKWMKAAQPMAARAGWNLTATKVRKSADGLDIKGLLDRIDDELSDAHPTAQWTMNFVLAEIGINHPKFRKRAIKIGEKHGVYRDYPTAKGCTSPFAPIWINAMVGRQG